MQLGLSLIYYLLIFGLALILFSFSLMEIHHMLLTFKKMELKLIIVISHKIKPVILLTLGK